MMNKLKLFTALILASTAFPYAYADVPADITYDCPGRETYGISILLNPPAMWDATSACVIKNCKKRGTNEAPHPVVVVSCVMGSPFNKSTPCEAMDYDALKNYEYVYSSVAGDMCLYYIGSVVLKSPNAKYGDSAGKIFFSNHS